MFLVLIIIINFADIGPEVPNALQGSIETPYRFVDKQIIVVNGKNIFLQAMSFLTFSYCEVYPPIGLHTNACFCRLLLLSSDSFSV